MIDIKTWGEFLFDLWKWLKKYWSNETDNFSEAIKEADTIAKKYNQRLFDAIILGCLDQKSFDSIRKQSITEDEIDRMNSAHYPLVK